MIIIIDSICGFRPLKRYGESISGVRYIAIKMGPVPNNFDGLLNWAREQDRLHVENQYFDDGAGERYFPGSNPFEREVLSEKELKTLEEVADKFKTTSTREIIRISHEEKGWEKCYPSQLISYHYAFELKNF